MKTRVWQGRRHEYATHAYFVGQVYDAKNELWVNATARYPVRETAERMLELYIAEHVPLPTTLPTSQGDTCT